MAQTQSEELKQERESHEMIRAIELEQQTALRPLIQSLNMVVEALSCAGYVVTDSEGYLFEGLGQPNDYVVWVSVPSQVQQSE